MNIKEIIMGFIIGDSFGLSILNNDITEIKLIDNKNENIPKGSYSFFSTNLLATIDSISQKNNIDPKDILNKLCMSLIMGKYTNDHKIYKVDEDTLRILEYYSKKNDIECSLKEYNLNAYPISRIIPVVIYNINNEDSLENIIKVVSITTNNEVVLLGSYILYKYIYNLINGLDKYKALKITIPKYFNKKVTKIYKDILKGNIYYKDITFDNNIVNVLKIILYVVLNSDNMSDMFLMISNLSGYTNIYSSIIICIGTIIYGFDSIDKKIVKNIQNKKEINKYIKNFERIFK